MLFKDFCKSAVLLSICVNDRCHFKLILKGFVQMGDVIEDLFKCSRFMMRICVDG